MSKIKAILVQPNMRGKVIIIENSLKALQKAVGGRIETMTFAEDAAVICNEEGRISNLPYNLKFLGHDFYGTILIVGINGEEIDSLSENVIDLLSNPLKIKREKWFVQSNPGVGYIAARIIDSSKPVHSGNIEYHGSYSENKSKIKELVCRLNEPPEFSEQGDVEDKLTDRLKLKDYRNKYISMIDTYLEEPHSISADWVELLKIMREIIEGAENDES